jgi:hypothetical protein
MQILFLSLGIIGLVMSFFGLKWLIQVWRSKRIAEIEFDENPHDINFENTGLHSISFVDAGYAKDIGNFTVSISKDEKYVDVTETLMKMKFHDKNRLTTEFYQFEIESIGKYFIQFKNIDDLEMKRSMLMPIRLFETRLNTNGISVLIRQAQSNTKRLTAILFLVFGVNISGWGFILASNLQLTN